MLRNSHPQKGLLDISRESQTSIGLKTLWSKIPRWVRYSTLVTLATMGIVVLVVSLIESHIKTNRFQMTHLRNFAIKTINTKMGKAVDAGVLEFHLGEGLVFEDFIVSSEEDFSFNRYFLKAHRIYFDINHIFSGTPSLRKITFDNVRINLELEDPTTKNILQYLRDPAIPQIELKNVYIKVTNGGKPYVTLNEPFNMSIYHDKDYIKVDIDKGYTFLPFFSSARGEVKLYGEEELVNLSLRFKNFNVESFAGIAQLFIGLPVENGFMDGEVFFDKTKEKSSGSAELKFSKVDIHDPIHTNDILFSKSSFQESFSFYFKDNVEEVGRKFFEGENSFNFIIKKKESDLLHYSIKAGINELNEVLVLIPFQTPITSSGKLKLDLEIEETGNKINWFQIEGNLLAEGIGIKSKDLELLVDEGSLDLKNNGSIQSKWKGKLFGKDFQSTYQSNTYFKRFTKFDKTPYYPMTMDGNWTINLTEFELKNSDSFLTEIRTNIKDDIRERQEKIIPEEQIIQSKTYKYFFESLSLNLQLQIGTLLNRKNNSMGTWSGNVRIQNGRMNSIIKGNLDGKSIFNLDMKSQFSAKNPLIVFSMEMKDLPWGDEIFKFCGNKFASEYISGNMEFTAYGNDYYEVSRSSRSKSTFQLNGLYTLANTQTKIPNAEITPENKYELSFNDDHFFDSHIIYSLYLKNEDTELRGNGQEKNGNYSYNLNGKLNKEPYTTTLYEEESRCFR
jgi:hypothetical protein